MKAVNMKNYEFKKESTTSIYMGYVLCKKSTAQTCINGALDLETCERVPVPVQ